MHGLGDSVSVEDMQKVIKDSFSLNLKKSVVHLPSLYTWWGNEGVIKVGALTSAFLC